jgi:hypothetical protein
MGYFHCPGGSGAVTRLLEKAELQHPIKDRQTLFDKDRFNPRSRAGSDGSPDGVFNVKDLEGFNPRSRAGSDPIL